MARHAPELVAGMDRNTHLTDAFLGIGFLFDAGVSMR
jgi:hypothetical protein